tara:strand:- start:152 stop:361 length:210 start_codon:yes stop_codon:yes gene_type:complete
MDKNIIRLKLKKDVKYSICSCGLTRKLPFCDNQHRDYNKKNNCSYKSVKIIPSNDIEIQVNSSNWNEKE